MFSNAFDRTDDHAVLDLLCSHGSICPLTERQVGRQIERWQSKAFAACAMEELGVKSAYGVEVRLQQQLSGLGDRDRPHFFDRMLKSGEPAVAKRLAEKGHGPGLWIEQLLAITSKPLSVLEEVIWRLLNPRPLTQVDWYQLAERYTNGLKLPLKSAPAVWIVKLPENGTEGSLQEHFIPRCESGTRETLTRTLLSLRRWEVNGNLLSYYMTLLEAIECCRREDADAGLALLQPECATFLEACFGRVKVAYPTSNINTQRARIALARAEFIKLKQCTGRLACGAG